MKKMFKILIKFLIISICVLKPFNSFANDNVLKIGNAEARVTVKVFSSLTCPHCAHFHKEVFEKLNNEYIKTGKVKFEHHAFPLDLAALNAEKILRCVDSKKRFQFLGEIYDKQEKWAVGSNIKKINLSLKKIGLNFNLDNEKVNKCLSDEKSQDQILNERINAQSKYKISSTPTIYINEKKYEGSHKYQDFTKTLKKYL